MGAPPAAGVPRVVQEAVCVRRKDVNIPTTAEKRRREEERERERFGSSSHLLSIAGVSKTFGFLLPVSCFLLPAVMSLLREKNLFLCFCSDDEMM